MRLRLALVGLLAAACSSKPRPPAVADAESGPDAAGADAPDAAPVHSCHDVLPDAPAESPYVLRHDQLGYALAGKPWAVVLGSGQAAPRYRLYALTSECWIGEEVEAGPRVLDATSRAGTPLTGDRVELSALVGAGGGAGDYLVVLDSGARLGPVHVGAAPYLASIPKLVRFLRAQRCGATTKALSQHAPCHLHASLTDGNAGTQSGDGVAVNDGYGGTVGDGTGPAADGEGGWHDAGDYIKFTGTTAFMLAVDLIALRDHQDALAAALGAQGYEELRAEMRWGLDWMMKMLAGSGATLYHQVSGERDHVAGFRLPESDTATPAAGYTHRPVFRFASGKGANILGRAAAAFAAASQVFADDPAYAAALLAAARHAYAEGKARPSAQSPVPTYFYGEGSFRDDLALGAALLAQVTGEAGFRADALAFARQSGGDEGQPLYWGGVDALALLEAALAFPDDSEERAELRDRLASVAAPILASATAPKGPGAAFGYALPYFGNGTIEQSLGAAVVCLAARRLSGPSHDGCVDVARQQLHWLWGQNPFGVSYQIGVGARFPTHVHHALASTAGIVLEGAVVGGPTGLGVIDGNLPVPGASDPYARYSTDDLLYTDEESNWIVNEPALDFTAPLVFIIAELTALDAAQ